MYVFSPFNIVFIFGKGLTFLRLIHLKRAVNVKKVMRKDLLLVEYKHTTSTREFIIDCTFVRAGLESSTL